MQPEERHYRAGERVPGTEYVVIRLEAEGGHGALYLVRHHFLEKKVQMLKTLRSFEPSKDLVERLKREAQMLAAMDHPHIVSVTSGGLTDEKEPRPYFVMERLKGRSLAQILPEAPEGVGIDAALKVTIELCDALEYVHVRHGVVHRDIKPDNIFLHITPRNGSLTKILDFGVAHIMDFERRYTKNNLFLGTPRYASPEQVMGEKPTPQTDLYAVGLVLYELLLGHGPFDDAQTFAAVATAHVHREPPAFPKTRRFPEGLEALVLSLLHKEPAKRPKSAEWLATRLRQIKRIAEIAEHAQADDLNQTDLSPVQNILTGHRAHLTEAGAPLELASEPTMSDHDEAPRTEASPRMDASESPFRATAMASSGVPVVDRAAPTRSLHVELPERKRNDTEQLAPELPHAVEPAEDPASTGPSSRSREPVVAPSAPSAPASPGEARRSIAWPAAALALAGIVLGGALVARYAGGAGGSNAEQTVPAVPSLAALPSAPPVAAATAVTPAPAVLSAKSASPVSATAASPAAPPAAPPDSPAVPPPLPAPPAKPVRAVQSPVATASPAVTAAPTTNPSVGSKPSAPKPTKPAQRLPSSGLE